MENFEWDEDKRQKNLIKHKLDFIDARFVFDDSYRIELEDERNGEMRYKTIGQVNGIVSLVVYTNRGKKKRIISARKANKDERKAYEEVL